MPDYSSCIRLYLARMKNYCIAFTSQTSFMLFFPQRCDNSYSSACKTFQGQTNEQGVNEVALLGGGKQGRGVAPGIHPTVIKCSHTRASRESARLF